MLRYSIRLRCVVILLRQTLEPQSYRALFMKLIAQSLEI